MTPDGLDHQLREASARIAELESARLRAETLFAVTQVLGKTLTLEDTFEAILSELGYEPLEIADLRERGDV